MANRGRQKTLSMGLVYCEVVLYSVRDDTRYTQWKKGSGFPEKIYHFSRLRLLGFGVISSYEVASRTGKLIGCNSSGISLDIVSVLNGPISSRNWYCRIGATWIAFDLLTTLETCLLISPASALLWLLQCSLFLDFNNVVMKTWSWSEAS